MPKWWMVRAGRNAVYIVDFLERGIVTIGGEQEGNLSEFGDQQEVLSRVQHTHPDWKTGKQRMWASQIYRFAHAIDIGDWVLTYDPERRIYRIGKVAGSYQFQPGIVADHPNYREVTWMSSLDRDRLSTRAKNSLGAISSLFRIPAEVGSEIGSLLDGNPWPIERPDAILENDLEIALLDDVEALEIKALESIKDQVSKLDWEKMQDLVAGVLRAMGYKTRVSPRGTDRGKDIVASPDGFGFENPRIVVEVKHRRATPMSSQDIRSFLGGRHRSDKGLYVSTGGFTKDAHYEAERAKIPMTLWSLEELVRALIDNYEALDFETKQLLPLKKIFWPIGA